MTNHACNDLHTQPVHTATFHALVNTTVTCTSDGPSVHATAKSGHTGGDAVTALSVHSRAGVHATQHAAVTEETVLAR